MLKRILSIMAVVSTVMAVTNCGSTSTPTNTVGTVAPINGVCPNANPIMQGNQQCAAYSQGSYCSGLPGTQLNSQAGYCQGSGTIPSNFYNYAGCGYNSGSQSSYACLPGNTWNSNANYGNYYGSNPGSYVNYSNGAINPFQSFSSGSGQRCGYVPNQGYYVYVCM